MKTYKDLYVWEKSVEMATLVHKLTCDFPKEELHSLTNQMRRVAVSVSSNIAKGSNRNSSRDLLPFLYSATGALSELETLLIIAHNLGYLGEEEKQEIDVACSTIFKMLSKFIQSLKNKEQQITAN